MTLARSRVRPISPPRFDSEFSPGAPEGRNDERVVLSVVIGPKKLGELLLHQTRMPPTCRRSRARLPQKGVGRFMDRDRFRQKVLANLLTHPGTLWPVVAGLSALMVAWGVDAGGGWLTMGGLGAVVAGLGTLATRWLLGSDDISERVFEQLQGEVDRDRQRRLDVLDGRLQADDDPRTEGLLRRLRAIDRDFATGRESLERLGAKTALDVTRRTDLLFQESVRSLERTLELWRGARQMRTREGRASLLEAREKIIQEIEENFQHLASTLDRLRTLELKTSDDERLAKLRGELQESLDVAYRVEERLQSLEDELDSPSLDGGGVLEK